jgi:hypothetical protein
MEGLESEKWLEAMKSEIRSMYDNQVWTLVDIPSDRKAAENKWIFKKKTDADGNVIVYKARFVAKGFRHIQDFLSHSDAKVNSDSVSYCCLFRL